jgi:type II secretory pathway pseudopilin PulG
MNKTIKNKKRGYSLIEALVALGILLMGIVPVITLASHAILFHYRAGESEEAARISQTMIDYIKSRGYNELELMVDTTSSFEKKYDLAYIESSSAFTVTNFGDSSNFNISQDMILLNSKGLNLNQVNFYVILNKTKGRLKKANGTVDTYTNFITGKSSYNAYSDDLIYGKIIFGMGKVTTDTSKKTGREKELETRFIVTPIENWK